MPGHLLEILRGCDLSSLADVVRIFPRDVQHAYSIVDQALEDAASIKRTILLVTPEERTYANTVAAYDEMNGVVFMASSLVGIVQQVSPEVGERAGPQRRLQQQAIRLCKDAAFYKAFVEYRDNGMVQEVLSAEQASFFEKAMKEFALCGYDRDAESFGRLSALQEKMQLLSSTFDANLNKDATTVAFFSHELTGIAPEYIAAQRCDEEGRVVLACNKTTMLAILAHCSNQAVRKAFKQAYDRRAFPVNTACLQELLTARYEYATALGFENYAAYALSRYMIETPAAAHALLEKVFESTAQLAARDRTHVLSCLPCDVTPSPAGKLFPWDVLYAEATYEKKTFNIDQRRIAQYFPVDKAFAAIFAIYEQFMGLSFEHHSTVPGAWHDSVQAVTVYTKDRSRKLGFVLLDLFPRRQKYFHACCWEVVPRVRRYNPASGMLQETPSVSVIVANFPLPCGDAPSLFLHSDITTFFHEFGHAMHNLMSCTAHTQTSGSMGVMLDFIEMPSQILEEWMWRPEMLRLVSGHYRTGQPLPEELVLQMTSMRKAGRSFFEMNQVYYSLLSLMLHEAKPPVDFDSILEACFKKAMRGLEWDPDNKFYASFAHLTMYGPAYYTYTLSRSYAYDVFARIEGRLLDPVIGKEFVDKILRPGGSRHPKELLADFLGRSASPDAYMQWLAQEDK